MRLEFTVYGKPQPQGSSRAFIVAGKARITSANKNLYPFRQEITQTALMFLSKRSVPSPAFAKHEPVALDLLFTIAPPPSKPKERVEHVVKPDLDKLIRAVCDALTGCVWHDDGQVVQTTARKVYGLLEGVRITVEDVEEPNGTR